MADQLWLRAEQDLRLSGDGAPADLLVWEHSARVARLIQKTLALPELASHSVDPAAMTAAGLYHDAGWVLQARAGEVPPRDLLLRPCTDLQRDMAADWLLERMAGVLGPGVLAAAARAIRLCNDRRTDCLEAQILAEADNLDSIGPSSIGLMIRKQLAEGKTLEDMVGVWERQEEYQYWRTRIRDSFRFPSVRAIAEARLDALRRFMRDLRAAVRLEDISSSVRR